MRLHSAAVSLFGREMLLVRIRAHAFKASRSSEWHFTGIYQTTLFPRDGRGTYDFDFPGGHFQSLVGTALHETAGEFIAPAHTSVSVRMGIPSI